MSAGISAPHDPHPPRPPLGIHEPHPGPRASLPASLCPSRPITRCVRILGASAPSPAHHATSQDVSRQACRPRQTCAKSHPIASCGTLPARAPALPGWPPARARSGPCERLLPFPRRCGRGAGGRRWGTVDGNDKGTAGREAFRSAGIPAPCVPTKSPDGCIGCRVARQRGTLPHGFTTPATPRIPLAPAGVRHTA